MLGLFTGGSLALDLTLTCHGIHDVLYLNAEPLNNQDFSRKKGLGFGVWGFGFGVWGLGFGVFKWQTKEYPPSITAIFFLFSQYAYHPQSAYLLYLIIQHNADYS